MISISEIFADQDLSADAHTILSTHEGCLALLKEFIADRNELSDENKQLQEDLQHTKDCSWDYYTELVELRKEKEQSDRNWGDLSEKFEGDRDAWRWAEVELWIERQNEKIARLRWFGGTMWEAMECCPLTGDDKKPFEHYLTDEVAEEYQ